MSSTAEQCIPKECKNDLVNRREVYRLALEKKNDWDFSQSLINMPSAQPETNDAISRKEFIERLEHVIQHGVTSFDGQHPVSAEVILEQVVNMPPVNPECDDCISRRYLYDKIVKLEDEAMKNVIEIDENNDVSKIHLVFIDQNARLYERTTFKHMIADAPSVMPVQPCGTGHVGIDEDYPVSVKQVLNITAEMGALETQSRVRKLPIYREPSLINDD